MPVPVSVTGETATLLLLVAVSDPLRSPVVAGVNVTLIRQLAPAVTLVPQLLVWLKSPVVAMPLMVSGALPVLVNVTLCAELETPTNWPAKPRLTGKRVATGALPTPDNATVGTAVLLLLVSMSVPLREPDTEGTKLTFRIQLAAGARLAPQLLV